MQTVVGRQTLRVPTAQTSADPHIFTGDMDDYMRASDSLLRELDEALVAEPQLRTLVAEPLVSSSVDRQDTSVGHITPKKLRDVHQASQCGDMTREIACFRNETIARSSDQSLHMVNVRDGPLENDRQILLLDASAIRVQDRCRQNRQNRLSVDQPTDAFGTGLVRSFTDMVGLTVSGPNVLDQEERRVDQREGRYMRVQMSLQDPTIDKLLQRAHEMYVSGCPLAEIRTQGCEMKHLVRIGINYDDWTHKCGYGLREVAFMGGGWQHAVAMGFLPIHMNLRDRNSPSHLVDAPFAVRWLELERDLGITIDEAVFDVGLTSADFAILGETLESLLHRGFGPHHVQHMAEPKSNFEYTLGATSGQLRALVSKPETLYTDSGRTAVSDTGRTAVSDTGRTNRFSLPENPVPIRIIPTHVQSDRIVFQF